jgi:hypothetical protein
MPIMSLQILQQRDLLLQFVDSLTTHGLLASSGRLRHSAGRSQATMVGACRKCCPWDRAQHHKLSSRRCAHRRTVEASGERDGSLQSGAACSAVSPTAMRSQACCRQGTVKCPEGANQLGNTVKVFLHGRQIPRRTQIRSYCSSWAWRSRRPWPMIVSFWQTGHSRGRRSNPTPARRCLSCLAVR